MHILVALLMGLWLAAGMAQADTVKLKNGTAVEGKVIEQTAEGVKVDIGGVTLTYYTDEVVSVVMGQAQAPQAPDTKDVVVPPSAGEASRPVSNTEPSPENTAQPVAATVVVDPLDGLNKDQLIRKFVMIYGVKENMQANFDQMIGTLKPEQAQAFRDAVKVDDIVEQLLPIYDKHFSEMDLKAYIRFYSSAEGKKLVSSLPLLMRDSVDVSMKYLDTHLPDSLKQPQQSQPPVSGN